MTLLYLGLEVPEKLKDQTVIHFPVIKIVPRPYEDSDIRSAFAELSQYTHILFTSKSAVRLFRDLLLHYGKNLEVLSSKCCIAVGTSTANALKQSGIPVAFTAQEEHAEGMISILNNLSLDNAYFFWPHSALSRSILTDFLKKRGTLYQSCILYDTVIHQTEPIPDLKTIDEIFFTSPSTVDAFLQIFGSFPLEKKLTAIGPITRDYLDRIK